MKRQRVSTACERCRRLKTKVVPASCGCNILLTQKPQCDGQHPSCGRCTGYGFNCQWATHTKRGIKITTPEGQTAERLSSSPDVLSETGDTESANVLNRLHEAYESLIQSVRPKLGDLEGAALDLTLESIRKGFSQTEIGQNEISRSEKRADDAIVSSPSYVGKASEIHFLDTVMDFVSQQKEWHTRDQGTSDHQRDDQTDVFGNFAFEKPLKLPAKEIALDYLDIYFSTIHIAYPFLSKPMVLHYAHRVLSGDLKDAEVRPWLALLSESRISAQPWVCLYD